MCGIVAAVSPAAKIVPVLLEGLRKLEYVGDESADNGMRSALIMACGTSNHAGVTARYCHESISSLLFTVQIAAEFHIAARSLTPKNLLRRYIPENGSSSRRNV